MFMNFMDYSTDADVVMFSKSQVTIMREYLQSAENTTLTLDEAPDDPSGDSSSSSTLLKGCGPPCKTYHMHAYTYVTYTHPFLDLTECTDAQKNYRITDAQERTQYVPPT